MNKDEAIQAMKDGKKVRHRFFEIGEYMESDRSGYDYTFENKYSTSDADFWHRRPQQAWLIDWSIVPACEVVSEGEEPVWMPVKISDGDSTIITMDTDNIIQCNSTKMALYIRDLLNQHQDVPKVSVDMLLVNAMRHLDDEGMKLLAESLLDRLPKQDSDTFDIHGALGRYYNACMNDVNVHMHGESTKAKLDKIENDISKAFSKLRPMSADRVKQLEDKFFHDFERTHHFYWQWILDNTINPKNK